MATIRCDFERVGRRRYAPPFTTDVLDADALAYEVHRYVRRFLASRDYEVDVEWPTAGEDGAGEIYAGGRHVGHFTATVVEQ